MLTSNADLAVAACGAALVLIAGLLLRRRPERVDGEEGFKALLRTSVRSRLGEAEADRRVPFHPLGRFVERKLADPASRGVYGAPLDGEVAFVAELAAMPHARARWARLSSGAPDLAATDRALKRWLGPSAEVSDAVGAARLALSRLSAHPVCVHARAGQPISAPPVADGGWVVIDASEGLRRPEVRAALAALRSTLHEAALWPALVDAAPAVAARASDIVVEAITTHVGEALLGAAEARGQLVVVVEGAAAPFVLRALCADELLRDQIAGLGWIGAVIGGLPGRAGALSEGARQDWLEAWFRHGLLDTEVVRRVPYMSVGWVDVDEAIPGARGLPLAHARLPRPAFLGTGRILDPVESEAVEVYDLGALDASLPPPEDLLLASVVTWVGLGALAGMG